MGITAVHSKDVEDPFQIVHLKMDAVLDYAEALIPGYSAGDAAPPLQDVYGISDNPRSDLVDVDALSINVTSELALLGAKEDGTLLARVRIEDEEGLIVQKTWDCILASRDGEGHMLPLALLSFEPIEEENE